ncbi:MAG: nuclear transport factor 2 family protein [Rhodospirillales bacterium]|jgi:ketosteroid isomerase-like protein|nr:nuclear transport factor 2 family protein [Rhodospirillales bacterium]
MKPLSRRSDRELILFANEAFYSAFATGDLDAMEKVWSTSAPCVCLHPGVTPLYGRDEVMDSWEHILTDPAVSDIIAHSPHVIELGDFAFVICYETLSGGSLVATNGFVREEGLWRMVSHQAGPCQDAPAPDEDEEEDTEPRLH